MLLEQRVNEIGGVENYGAVRFAPVVHVARPATDPQAASLLRAGLAATDLVALGVAVVAAAVAVGQVSPVAVLFGALACVTLAIARPRPLPVRLGALKELPKVAVRLAMCSMLVLPVAALAGQAASISLPVVLALLLVPSSRAVAYAVVRRRRRLGRSTERAMVVASSDVTGALAQVMLEHPECGLVPVVPQVLDLTGGASLDRGLPVVSVRALAEQIAKSDARHIVLDPRAITETELSDISDLAASRGVHLHLLGGWAESMLVPAIDSDDLWGFALFSVRRPTLVSWRLKRALDVSAAAALLLFLSPLLAVAALAVRLTSRGPVLFRQPRVGQNGRIIDLLKFRTYPVDHVDSEWSLTNDDCPLPVGRFLRRTSIDELPQLWNILRGDMSLVGPRPERPHFAEPLSTRVEGYSDRHRLPMGLTGLAQVQGLWGQTSIDDRVRFDNHYIEHWSLWGDIVIVLQTIPELLRRSLRS